MAQIKIYKLNELFEVQHFLNGGILGADISKGVSGLIGLVITFTLPSFSHTFVAGADPDLLRYLEIKTQLEAASTAALKVVQFGGRIGFIQATPTTGCVLSGTTQPAKALLGFDYNTATVGKVYDSPHSATPTVPYLIQSYSVNETTHVVYTFE